MNRFEPPRRRGLILHITASLILLAGGGTLFYFAMQEQVGTYFVLFLLFSLILLGALPLVVYRGYALLTADYILERDGLRLHWGLREEDIPLPDIEWIRPADELGFNLPLPFLVWPGALLGTRRVEGLGPVEFLASEVEPLLLVATPSKVFAISPADPDAFSHLFQRTTELGSLDPLPSYSVQPAAFVRHVWNDSPARILILAGFILTLLLLVVTSLLIPAGGAVPVGFTPAGVPQQPGPAERLLLLPVLALFAFVTDLILGLFLYRLDSQRPVAYLLWAGTVLTPLLLFIAVFLLV